MVSSIIETDISDANVTDELVKQIKSSRIRGGFKDEVDNVTLEWLHVDKGLSPTEIQRLFEADGIEVSYSYIVKRLKTLKV